MTAASGETGMNGKRDHDAGQRWGAVMTRSDVAAASATPEPAPGQTASGPGPKIVLRGLERTFAAKNGSVHALGPIDLSIEEGEFCCVVGPSGCGKSTMLRILAGLANPSGGEALIWPRNPKAVPVAMVFQDYSIYPWKTVAANVALGLDLAHMPKAEKRKRVSTWLEKLRLSEFADAYPATLSGGMRQRVSIARALVVEPEVLLMDEPFAALDAQLRLVMQEELLRLWEADRRTVVFITHSLEEALLLGDRVVVMSARPGRILSDIRVPFSRPRSPELRGEAEFAALQEQVWELLRREVREDSHD
jgi:NitT/TauT family transport system ATP-binding protein